MNPIEKRIGILEQKVSRYRNLTLFLGLCLAAVVLMGIWGCASDYEKGMEAFEQRNYDEALISLKKVKEGDKDYENACFKISSIYYKQGKQAYNQVQFRHSLKLLQKIDKKFYDEFPDIESEVNFATGMVYYNREQWEQSLSIFKLIKHIDKNFPDAQLMIKEVEKKMELPKHTIIENTSLAPKDGRRIIIRVYDANLTKDQCRDLINKYRINAGSEGQVTVNKPSAKLMGEILPWCVDNMDGKGIFFNDDLF